jgi:Flp pilus assembly protein TadG
MTLYKKNRNIGRHLGSENEGSQIAELAVSLPILVVFVVGIFDFSGALTLKQKLTHAAQEGATIAAGQPTHDLSSSAASVKSVGDSVFDYLAGANALPRGNQGSCKKTSATFTKTGGTKPIWTYKVTNCPSTVTITIDRGDIFPASTGDKVISSHVSVQYSYNWQFGKVISLVATGTTYAGTTVLQEDAFAANQL